jgi:hypothetical protein
MVVLAVEGMRMTREKFKKELEASLLALSADPSLGYLAVTSKPELPIRDRVAWYFHRKHPSFIAAREYYIKSLDKNSKRGKRVDLALLKKASLAPVALVEFKAMIVPDPLNNPEHQSMVSLIDDLNKLANITRVPRLGVMLMVHIANPDPLKKRQLDRGVVKFMSKFCTWAKEPDALEKASENVERFFVRAKLNVSALTIEPGSAWGVGVKLIAFILEPR